MITSLGSPSQWVHDLEREYVLGFTPILPQGGASLYSKQPAQPHLAIAALKLHLPPILRQSPLQNSPSEIVSPT